MTFGFKAKLAVSGLAIITIGYTGWMARGWFEDSRDLAAIEAQERLTAKIRSDLDSITQAVEGQLQGLKANERIIDRGIIREIEKPVYRNVCIPDDSDAFRLLNDLAAGKAASKPDDQGSPNAAAAD